MDENTVMIDLKNIKKKYVIRHKIQKPDSFKGRLKLVARKVLHPSKRADTEDFWALDGVSFQVKKGEKVGIIGRNGAGKSTLLKVLSRITEPTDGRIEMLGKVSAMLEVGTGFNMELTGRENVYLNGAILGMSKDEIDEKFDEIVKFSEVGRFIDTPVKRYSSGMFVRLAFAVASHLEPDILIVDEVLAVGDTRFQQKCLSRMSDIARGGRTILYVSHQMQTIRQLCDRVIVLKEGKVIYDGDVEKGIEVYSDSVETNKTVIDASDHKPRGTQMAVIQGAVISNKETCAWVYNEPIDFKVKIKANEDCENLRLEFMIRSIGLIRALGKAESVKLGKFEKGKEYTIDFHMDNKNILAPGKYIAGFELWKTENEMCTIHDVIPDMFSFEILGEDPNDESVPPIAWDSLSYGGMMLPEIQVTNRVEE